MRFRESLHPSLLVAVLALHGCDSTASTGSPSAAPEESAPQLQARASWILTDTGRFVRDGRALRLTTREIPRWHCEGAVRVRDTAKVVASIELDAKGRPVRMVERDTLEGGSVVVAVSRFFPVDGVWASATTDSVIKAAATDSTALRVRRKLVETRVLELAEKASRVRIFLAGWDYAPAWVAGLVDLPAHVAASVSSANVGRLQNRNTGEVVTTRFQPTLGGPRIDWSSSRSFRAPATTGGIPSACPAATVPDWLGAFLSGR